MKRIRKLRRRQNHLDIFVSRSPNHHGKCYPNLRKWDLIKKNKGQYSSKEEVILVLLSYSVFKYFFNLGEKTRPDFETFRDLPFLNYLSLIFWLRFLLVSFGPFYMKKWIFLTSLGQKLKIKKFRFCLDKLENTVKRFFALSRRLFLLFDL